MQTVYSQETVDFTTGELTSKTWIKKQAKSAEHFVKMYIEDLASLNFLSNADYRLLVQLATLLEYNTNNFTMTKERRAVLAGLCGITIGTFNVCFARLVKKKLILKIESAIYQMNPKFFFNGDEIQRSSMMKVVLEYQICADC